MKQIFFIFLCIAALILGSSTTSLSQDARWLETDTSEFSKLIPLFGDAKASGKVRGGTVPNHYDDTLSIGLWKDIHSGEELQITQVYPYIKGNYKKKFVFNESSLTEEATVVGKNLKGHILLVMNYRGGDSKYQDYFEYFEGHCYSYVKKGPYYQPYFIGKMQNRYQQGPPEDAEGFFRLDKQ